MLHNRVGRKQSNGFTAVGWPERKQIDWFARRFGLLAMGQVLAIEILLKILKTFNLKAVYRICILLPGGWWEKRDLIEVLRFYGKTFYPTSPCFFQAKSPSIRSNEMKANFILNERAFEWLSTIEWHSLDSVELIQSKNRPIGCRWLEQILRFFWLF